MWPMTRGAAAVLIAVACVSASGFTTAAAQTRAGGAAVAMPDLVRSRSLPDGTLILTDTAGMTLYTFLKDTPQQSNCNGECAAQWPPVPAAGTPPSDAWTVIERMDGSKQWAYRGRPLYGWVKDRRPGDITGEGVGNGAWKIAVVDSAPNLLKVHLAYVTTAFPSAPKGQGLLPTAAADAKIAAQHGALAADASGNLETMKLHAGHVLNAIDPGVERTGPGSGFGVRPAALAIVDQVQLASKVTRVTPGVLSAGTRVLVSSGAVVKRSDEIVVVAQRIRAATTAAEAAPDALRLGTLTKQLTSGTDVNKDGRIGWQTAEAGLEQVEAQMQLMLKGGD